MKQFRLILKISLTAILLFSLARHVDWTTVWGILVGASLPLIALYLALQILGNLISAWKWRYAGTVQDFHFPLKDGFFAYLSGAFINNFLPSTIGGDAYRTLWMSESGERLRAFTVVFFDRISGLLTLFLLSGAGFFLLPANVFLDHPWLLFLAFFIAVMAAVIVIALGYAKVFLAFGLYVASLLPWPKIKEMLLRFSPFADTRVYAKTLGIALLFMIVGVGMSNFALFHSLGSDIGPLHFLAVIFLATLVANVPVSINNIGVKEWSYVFFFGLVGVSAELAVTVALLSRFLQMLLSFLALPWYLGVKGLAGVNAQPPSTDPKV